MPILKISVSVEIRATEYFKAGILELEADKMNFPEGQELGCSNPSNGPESFLPAGSCQIALKGMIQVVCFSIS
jgi:hypothetical protein